MLLVSMRTVLSGTSRLEWKNEEQILTKKNIIDDVFAHKIHYVRVKQ